MKSTENYLAEAKILKSKIKDADAVVVGAGAGMSLASGFAYSGERFEKNFSDFRIRYGFSDMYSGGFYPYKTLEEYWAWWSRFILLNRYDQRAGKSYLMLFELIKESNYFVLTTNVDHQFQFAGFDKKRLFYTQGDYGLWQCSKPCHQKTYDNETVVRKMLVEQKNMKIPSGLIPYCPACGAPMSMNLRADDTFVEDEGWHAAAQRYAEFLRRHEGQHILFLELGVGGNTPVIIKYPFWRMTYQNPKAVYACVNLSEAYCPREIQRHAICIDKDIGKTIGQISKYTSI